MTKPYTQTPPATSRRWRARQLTCAVRSRGDWGEGRTRLGGGGDLLCRATIHSRAPSLLLVLAALHPLPSPCNPLSLSSTALTPCTCSHPPHLLSPLQLLSFLPTFTRSPSPASPLVVALLWLHSPLALPRPLSFPASTLASRKGTYRADIFRISSFLVLLSLLAPLPSSPHLLAARGTSKSVLVRVCSCSFVHARSCSIVRVRSRSIATVRAGLCTHFVRVCINLWSSVVVCII